MTKRLETINISGIGIVNMKSIRICENKEGEKKDDEKRTGFIKDEKRLSGCCCSGKGL
ncbi:hypothetical protein LBYZC6_08850 [Lacrimispora brassicae]